MGDRLDECIVRLAGPHLQKEELLKLAIECLAPHGVSVALAEDDRSSGDQDVFFTPRKESRGTIPKTPPTAYFTPMQWTAEFKSGKATSSRLVRHLYNGDNTSNVQSPGSEAMLTPTPIKRTGDDVQAHIKLLATERSRVWEEIGIDKAEEPRETYAVGKGGNLSPGSLVQQSLAGQLEASPQYVAPGGGFVAYNVRMPKRVKAKVAGRTVSDSTGLPVLPTFIGCKLHALIRGHIVRSLMRTSKVQDLARIVKDSVIFLQSERGDPTPLQLQVTAQLRAARSELHQLFVIGPAKDRIKLIGWQRELARQRLSKEALTKKTTTATARQAIKQRRSLKGINSHSSGLHRPRLIETPSKRNNQSK